MSPPSAYWVDLWWLWMKAFCLLSSLGRNKLSLQTQSEVLRLWTAGRGKQTVDKKTKVIRVNDKVILNFMLSESSLLPSCSVFDPKRGPARTEGRYTSEQGMWDNLSLSIYISYWSLVIEPQSMKYNILLSVLVWVTRISRFVHIILGNTQIVWVLPSSYL